LSFSVLGIPAGQKDVPEMSLSSQLQPADGFSSIGSLVDGH